MDTFLKNISQTICRISRISLILGIMIIIYFSNKINIEYKNIDKEIDGIEEKTKRYSEAIDLELSKLQDITTNLNNIVKLNLLNGLDTNLLKIEFEKIFKKNNGIFGLGICLDPNFNNNKYFSPYWYRSNSIEKLNNIHDNYSYIDKGEKSLWYHQIIEGENWIEPYYGHVAETYLAEFGIPIKDNNNKTIGIVYCDYSLENLKNIMKKLNFGETGHGYLVSENANIIYYPNNKHDYKKGVPNLLDIADKQKDDGDLSTFVNNIVKNKNAIAYGKMKYHDKSIGQQAWRTYSKIEKNNWTLVSIFPAEEIQLDYKKIKFYLILIVFFSSITLVSIVWIIFFDIKFKYGPINKSIWGFQIVCNFILFLSLILIWFITLKYNSISEIHEDNFNESRNLNNNRKIKAKILNEEGLFSFLEKHNLEESVLVIPIVLQINFLDLSSENTVKINGEIYAESSKYNVLEKDISFSENKVTNFEFLEQRKLIDSTLINSFSGDLINKFKFSLELNKVFDNSKYPFDAREIAIKIKSKNDSIIFVPGIKFYESTNPISNPAIIGNVNFGGWRMEKSFFEMKMLEEKIPKSNKTDVILDYKMHFSRNFLEAFISDLLPFMIICIFIYILILTLTNIEIKSIIDTAIALFFSLLFSHYKLRDSLEFNGIVFIEYFYFLLYLILVLFVVNRFLFSSKKSIAIIDYKDNLIAKVAFWPFLLALLLSISTISLL